MLCDPMPVCLHKSFFLRLSSGRIKGIISFGFQLSDGVAHFPRGCVCLCEELQRETEREKPGLTAPLEQHLLNSKTWAAINNPTL